MKNKIYILEAYGGQWEDNWDKILGVYDSEELAKSYELSYLTKINEIKKNAPPYPNDELDNLELYDEMWLKHHEYWKDNSQYEDVAGTRIRPFELNKPI